MSQAAIIIAWEKIDSPGITSKTYAASDARAFADVLCDVGCRPDAQLILIDEGLDEIESSARAFLAGLSPDDSLAVFLSGRMTPSGAELLNDKLFDRIAQTPLNRIAFFLDTPGIDIARFESNWSERFAELERRACFVSCDADEDSYTNRRLKHGVWAHHLIEVFKGEVPRALDTSGRPTAQRLQDHLEHEVPRMVRRSRRGKHDQSPWMLSGTASDFAICDVPIPNASPDDDEQNGKERIKDARLFHESTQSFRKLTGFTKRHRVPDEVTPASERFLHAIALKELEEDLDRTYQSLKSAFRFKRRDIETQGPADGGAVAVTPFFNYEASVALDPDDPSTVVWRREVTSIREPDAIMTDEFESVFGRTFHTLEFQSEGGLDIEGIVDRIEELERDEITVEYDRELTWCEIRLEGVPTQIRLADDTFQIHEPEDVPPRRLIESFFEIKRRLVETYDVRQLPF